MPSSSGLGDKRREHPLQPVRVTLPTAVENETTSSFNMKRLGCACLALLMCLIFLGAGFGIGWGVHAAYFVLSYDRIQMFDLPVDGHCRIPDRGVAGGLEAVDASTLLFVSTCLNIHSLHLTASNEWRNGDPYSHNLRDFIRQQDILKFTYLSEETLYVSYVHNDDGCYSIRVVRAPVASDRSLVFSNIFDTDGECVSGGNLELHAAGGKLLAQEDGTLYVTLGDYLESPSRAQNMNSVFGKIWRRHSNGTKEIVSVGHRNPQGLCPTRRVDGAFLETEHGPRGGDEINMLHVHAGGGTPNYGWPLASYGTHYNGTRIPDDHATRGFVEPTAYFPWDIVGSHGIGDCSHLYGDVYAIASLNGRKLYVATLEHTRSPANTVIAQMTSYNIGLRTRRIVRLDSCRVLLLTERHGTDRTGPLVEVNVCGRNVIFKTSKIW